MRKSPRVTKFQRTRGMNVARSVPGICNSVVNPIPFCVISKLRMDDSRPLSWCTSSPLLFLLWVGNVGVDIL